MVHISRLLEKKMRCFWHVHLQNGNELETLIPNCIVTTCDAHWQQGMSVTKYIMKVTIKDRSELVYNQHSPSSEPKTKHFNKFLKLWSCKRFSKDIGYIPISWNIVHKYLCAFDNLTNEMISNVNMFSVSVKFVVL